MVICSYQVFSTHFTCHRAEVACKLPCHGLISFWLFLFCLQGHRLYKKVTFYYSSFNNDRFFNGWYELLQNFKQGKNFTITFTTNNIFRYFSLGNDRTPKIDVRPDGRTSSLIYGRTPDRTGPYVPAGHMAGP